MESASRAEEKLDATLVRADSVKQIRVYSDEVAHLVHMTRGQDTVVNLAFGVRGVFLRPFHGGYPRWILHELARLRGIPIDSEDS